MENIFFILFLLTLGYVLKFAKFPDNFAQSLNQIVIFVSLPATILLQVPKIHFDTSLLIPFITPWLVLVLSVLIVLLFGRNLDDKTKAALLLLIPMGNTSFFGFPMIESLLGHQAITYAIIYDQLGTFLILATYGSFILSYYGGQAATCKQIVFKILTFPPFVFLLIAFFVGELPHALTPYVQTLASTLTPLAIISVGFSMRLRLGDDKSMFFKAISLKLIVIPLMVFLFFKLAGFESLSAKTTILESAMPPMITSAALAINAGFAPRLSSALVGYGIIFSLLTLSLMNILL